MTRLVQSLPDGPLDIIGDVHGELDALLTLLHRLGVDPERPASDRTLVFVGDLIDRGPDSPGVVAVVRRLVESGTACCVAGNHELNLLLGEAKEGNGWARGDASDHHQVKDGTGTRKVPFPSRLASEDEVASMLGFFRSLPLALVRDDIRVVHACWSGSAVGKLPERADLATYAHAEARRIDADLASRGLLTAERLEFDAFADLKSLDVRPDRPLPAHTEVASRQQSEHPVKVLTSGLEVPLPFKDIFFVGGKWRFVRRDSWWHRYEDAAAVVVGHYWRRREGRRVQGKPDAWETPRWTDWTGPRGNVFCVDYSVGRRFVEREQGRTVGFHGGLAALRWPERTLVLDDRSDVIATTAWGDPAWS